MNSISPNRHILILFLCLVLCYVLASALMGVAFYALGYNLNEIDFSQPKTFIIQAVISQIGIFALCLVLYLLITKQKLTAVIHFKTPQVKIISLVFICVLVTLPIVGALGYINSFIKEWIPNNFFILQEEATREIQESLLANKNPLFLVVKIIVIAVFPAFFEEFIFRGVLQKQLWEASNNKHYAVVITAILFALIHLQPTALLPMTFLAIVIGYFYTETKNIWYSVFFHFLFNLSSILIGFWS